MKIQLKVVPGSSRDCIAGWLGECLKIRVKAPPESGKANKAVEKLLAATLQVPVGSVSIIRGESSQKKVVEISGLGRLDFEKRLQAWQASAH